MTAPDADDAALSALIGAVYEGALRPEAWPAFLDAFRARVGAAAVHLRLRFYGGAVERVVQYASSGLDERLQDLYLRHLFRQDPYARRMPMQAGEVFDGARELPLRAIRGTGYYNAYMRPQGLMEPVLVGVGHVPGLRAGVVELARGRGSPPWGDDLRRTIALFLPHWQRAFELYARLDADAAVGEAGGPPPAPSAPRADPPGPAREEAACAALRAAFGLTPAEGRVALLLARGLAPKEAARALGTSLWTVRSQLKRVYHKVGVGRQAELVARAGAVLRGAPA